MLSLNHLDITDSYIKAFVDLSSKYDNLDRDIEYVRFQMGGLRYDLYLIKVSKEERENIHLLLARYLVIFRDLMIERDKRPKPLFIRIPYCPDYFPYTPSPENYRYRSHYS